MSEITVKHTAREIIDAVESCDWYEMPDEMVFDACVLCGIPADAAEFISEWYPELSSYAYNRLRYGHYDWATFGVLTEKELAEMLEWNDCTEEEYEEKYGIIIRDAAFDGVLVCGE